MNFIKSKKIHKSIIVTVLFLSLGFSGFYSVRGVLAAYAGSGLTSFNDVWAFILSALINGLVYELATFLCFKFLTKKLGRTRTQDMRYALRFFMVPAGICSGALKLLYFSYPYVFPYGEVLFEFIFMLIFFIPYLMFCCKSYCKKEEYAEITMSLGSVFLSLFAILAVFSLLTEVMAL